MDKDLLRPMDVIEFKQGFGKKKIGILLEVFSGTIIIYFDKNKFHMAELSDVSVLNVYRNWVYGYSFDLFDHQDRVFSLFSKNSPKSKELFKKLNKKTPVELMAIYFITSSEVSYPAEFLTNKITLKDLVNPMFGYTRVNE